MCAYQCISTARKHKSQQLVLGTLSLSLTHTHTHTPETCSAEPACQGPLSCARSTNTNPTLASPGFPLHLHVRTAPMRAKCPCVMHLLQTRPVPCKHASTHMMRVAPSCTVHGFAASAMPGSHTYFTLSKPQYSIGAHRHTGSQVQGTAHIAVLTLAPWRAHMPTRRHCTDS